MRDPRDHIREVSTGATEPKKNSLQGNIAELGGNNVYQYGTQDQGDRFTRRTDRGNSWLCWKRVRLLMKNQKEKEPKEPVMPDKEEAKLPLVMKKYATELNYFKKERKKERYQEHKAKLLVILKGQCTLNLNNKVESLEGYDSIEASNDVINLLKALKELTFKMHTTRNVDTGQYARQ
jgi:hypothetical protein